MKFCEEENVPKRERLPASPELVGAFAAWRLGEVSGATARNDVASVRAMHIRNGFGWPNIPQLPLILEGMERKKPKHAVRELREAATGNHLRALATFLHLSDPSGFDPAVRAAACSALWGQLRLGELLPTSEANFSLNMHPSRGDLSFETELATIHLPFTKTARTRGAEITLFSQNSRTCAIQALREYLEVVPASPTDHILCYKDRFSGRLRPLTKSAFLRRINQVFREQGLKELKGHSFRIGGTTELLCMGVSPEIVKVAGRWASDSFLRYWRKHKLILPKHIKNIVVTAKPHRNAARSG